MNEFIKEADLAPKTKELIMATFQRGSPQHQAQKTIGELLQGLSYEAQLGVASFLAAMAINNAAASGMPKDEGAEMIDAFFEMTVFLADNIKRGRDEGAFKGSAPGRTH